MVSLKCTLGALTCFSFLVGVALADFSFQNATLSLSAPSETDLRRTAWDSTNQTYTSLPPNGNGPPVTITIVATARPIPEDQIFVGLIASLALIYDKYLPPAGPIPATGFQITFTAGLRHAIFLEPLSGQSVNWAQADSVLKALGLTVFNKRTATEILFDVAVNGRRVAKGGITDSPKAVLKSLPKGVILTED
ncbi:MAG: hypothetical protein Q9217_003995 [Psora testacea]